MSRVDAKRNVQVSEADRRCAARVLEEVATRYGRQPRDLLDRSNFRIDTLPRFAVMGRLYDEKLRDGRRRFSTLRIGKLINRDHSTVVEGLKRHRVMATIDAMAKAIAGPAE